MAVFRELLGEKWQQDIGSALYQNDPIAVTECLMWQNVPNCVNSFRLNDPIWRYSAWYGWWLVAGSSPSHHAVTRIIIVYLIFRNTFQWPVTYDSKTNIVIQEKKLKISYAKCRPLCQGPISRLRWIMVYLPSVNTLRPKQNGRHFPHDIFKCILLNEIKLISIKICPKFVPKGLINNILALIHTVDWYRQGDKPLSEPVMISFRTHICVTRPR